MAEGRKAREYRMEIPEINYFWEVLAEHQNEIFYTAKKLPFTYTIRGGEMFIDRRSKSLTRSTFEKALKKLEEHPKEITGPKSLNVFGAPYIWALFCAFRVATKES